MNTFRIRQSSAALSLCFLLAAGFLENAGLIQNLRGTVKILNRKSLEDTACECYGIIQHFNGSLGLK